MKWIAKVRNNKYSNTIIRVLIFATTYFFLYLELFKNKRLEVVFDAFENSIRFDNFLYYLIPILVLMPANWALETLKWRLLIGKIEKISFWNATQAVYSGISVSMFTPNRVGEWFGRIFILEKANHIRAVIITILSGMGQLFTTIIVGILSTVIFLKIYYIDVYHYSNLVFAGILSVAFLILTSSFIIFYNINTLPIIINQIFKKSFKKINYYVDVVSQYSYYELSIIIFISYLRFTVFSFQFYLSLRMFSIDIPFFHGMLLTGVFYFVMTAIPTITLAELGIRGVVSIFFFELYYTTFQPGIELMKINVVAASYVIWIINLVIPAIFGTFFVFHLKFIRKKKGMPSKEMIKEETII
jgi:hypothetical protein